MIFSLGWVLFSIMLGNVFGLWFRCILICLLVMKCCSCGLLFIISICLLMGVLDRFWKFSCSFYCVKLCMCMLVCLVCLINVLCVLLLVRIECMWCRVCGGLSSR